MGADDADGQRWRGGIRNQGAAMALALMTITLAYLVLNGVNAPSLFVWVLAGLSGFIIYEYSLEWLEKPNAKLGEQ